MKALLVIGIVMLLCSCGTTPQVHTSFSHDGRSFSSMDMTDPHFYMDDDRPAPEVATPPQYHSVDGFCASNCQSRGGGAGYCNKACGF